MNPLNIEDKDLKVLLASDIFLSLINSKVIRIAELQAAVGLLIKAGITFDLSFDRETPRNEALAELVIFISPTLQLRFSLSLGPGPSTPVP